MARAFMARGHHECATAEATDFAGLATVLDFCQGLSRRDDLHPWQPVGSNANNFVTNVLQPARAARNGFAHGSYMGVEPNDMKTHTSALQQLVNLLPLPDASDEAKARRDAALGVLNLAMESCNAEGADRFSKLKALANKHASHVPNILAYLRGVYQLDLDVGAGHAATHATVVSHRAPATGGAGSGAGAGAPDTAPVDMDDDEAFGHLTQLQLEKNLAWVTRLEEHIKRYSTVNLPVCAARLTCALLPLCTAATSSACLGPVLQHPLTQEATK